MEPLGLEHCAVQHVLSRIENCFSYSACRYVQFHKTLKKRVLRFLSIYKKLNNNILALIVGLFASLLNCLKCYEDKHNSSHIYCLMYKPTIHANVLPII